MIPEIFLTDETQPCTLGPIKIDKNPFLLKLFSKQIQLEKGKINFFPKSELSPRFYDQFKAENCFGVNTGFGTGEFTWNKDVELSDLKVYTFGKDAFDKQMHLQTLVGGKIFRFEEKDENNKLSYCNVEDNDVFFSVLMKNFNPFNTDLLIVNDFVSGLSPIAKIAFYQQLKQVNKMFNMTILLVTEDILNINISKVEDFVLFADENQKYEIQKFFELIEVVGNEDLYEKVIKEISDERIRLYEKEQKLLNKQIKEQEKINHPKKKN